MKNLSRLIALVWCFCAVPAFSQIVLIKDRAQVATYPALEDALRRTETTPIDPQAAPHIPQVITELGALTQRLETAADKPITTYVVLSRSASVNAYFLKLNAQERLVVVNAGLLFYSLNDHRTIFVLGHEYEHGWSELQDFLNQRPDTVVQKMLQRAVENEVDLKSVFKRMIPAGADPYEAFGFLRQLRNDFGSDASESHTSTASREQSGSLGITLARRELGMEISLEPPKLPTRLRETLHANGYTLNAYVASLVEELKAFPHIRDAVKAQFRNTTQVGYERLRHTNTYFQVQPLVALEKETWSSVTADLPPSTPFDLYVDLKKAHIEKFAKYLLMGARRYNQRSLTPQEFSFRLKMLGLHDPKQKIREAQNELAATQERLKELSASSSESAQKWRKEYEERERREKTNLLLLEKLSPTWKQVNASITLARNTLLAGEPQHCTTASIHANDLLTLIGTPLEEKIWEAAEVYARTFDVDYRHGEMGFREHLLWEALYKLDAPRATNLWKLYLVQSLESLKTSDSDYAQSALTFPIAIRSRLGNFKEYPLYEAAIAEVVFPLTESYVGHVLAARTKKPAKQAGDWAHLHYTLGKTLAATQLIRKIAADGMASQAAVDKFQNALFDLNQKLIQEFVAGLSPEARAEMPMTPDQLHRAAVLKYPEPLRSETLARLGGMKVLPALHGIARYADNEFVRRSLVDAGFSSFFTLMRLMDPQTKEGARIFYETFHQVSGGSPSFVRAQEPELPFLDPHGRLWAGYLEWVIQNHPEEEDVIKELFDYPQPPSTYYSPGDLDEAAQKTWNDQMQVFRDTWTRVDKAELRRVRHAYMAKKIAQWIKDEGVEAAARKSENFYSYFEDGVSQQLRHFPEKARVLHLWIFDREYSMDMGGFSGESLDAMKDLIAGGLSQADLKQLAEAYVFLATHSDIRSLQRDEFFEFFWKNANEEIKGILSQQKVVAALVTHRAKRRIFAWRYEHDVLALPAADASDPTSIRPAAQKAYDLLTELFPEVSDLRDALIDETGNDLVTNPAETDLLYALCTRPDNWYESKGLMLLDVPQQMNRMVSTNQEKMAFLRLFTGQITAPQLVDILGDRIGFPKHLLLPVVSLADVRFRESNHLIRTYILMALLDDHDGLLSSPEYTEQVYAMLLGKYAGNKIARAAFDAYFGAVHPSEKQVLIARILAGMVDTDDASKGFVRRIVDGLKTLGYKSAQFARAAGIVPPSMEEEFEGVFDRATKPRRDKVLARLRAAFGRDLDGAYFGGLLGYGSVNWVVAVDFKVGAARIPAAVRALHDNVAGQIRNEAEVWQRAIPTLEAHADAEVRMLGTFLRDALASGMETLGQGGSEVDLSIDRELIKKAEPVYQTDAEQTRSGYSIQVVPVLTALQARVAAAEQKSVSVHPRISVGSMRGHPRAAALAQDAVDTELHAAYERGKWDLDTHPGNWFVDDTNHILWRSDVSQFRTVEHSADLERQRRLLHLLMKPTLTVHHRHELTVMSPYLFQTEGVAEAAVLNTFKDILETYGTPENNPVSNLYFYRRKLQETLNAPVRFTQQTLWYVQTLARSRMHAEAMGGRVAGNLRFFQALGRAGGHPPRRTALNFAVHAAKSCARAVLLRNTPQ